MGCGGPKGAGEEADFKQMLLFQQGKSGAPNPGMYYWLVEKKEDVVTEFGKTVDAFFVIYRTVGGPSKRWFKEKVGLVRESSHHAGTYIESDSILREFHGKRQ